MNLPDLSGAVSSDGFFSEHVSAPPPSPPPHASQPAPGTGLAARAARAGSEEHGAPCSALTAAFPLGVCEEGEP